MAGYGDKPFGMRQLRFVKSATVVDAPAAMELSFKELITSDQLKGNDKIVEVVAIADGAEFELSNGGISLELYALLTGRSAVEAGSTPNRTLTLTGAAQAQFPYVKIYGKAIGPNSDDVHCKLLKAKMTEFEGKFEQDKFFITSAKGIAIDDGSTGVFVFVQNETAANLPTS